MPFLLWKLVNQLQKQFPNPVWFYCVWPGRLISTSSCWEQRGNFTSSFTFICLDKRGMRRAVRRVVWLCAGMGGALPQALGWQLLSSWRKQSHRKSFTKVFGHPTWGIYLKMLFEAFIWFCVFIISFFWFFSLVIFWELLYILLEFSVGKTTSWKRIYCKSCSSHPHYHLFAWKCWKQQRLLNSHL